MPIDRRILSFLYYNNIKDVDKVEEFIGFNDGFYEIKMNGEIIKLIIPTEDNINNIDEIKTSIDSIVEDIKEIVEDKIEEIKEIKEIIEDKIVDIKEELDDNITEVKKIINNIKTTLENTTNVTKGNVKTTKKTTKSKSDDDEFITSI